MTMQTFAELRRIADIIGAVPAPTEKRFLAIGDRLGLSGEMLATLADSFHALSGELAGENLRHSTSDLAAVARRVSTLADVRSGATTALGQLGVLIAAIEGRIVRMAKSVSDAGALAINAKIVVAQIGDDKLELASFAAEIGATLRLAQTSLAQFAAALAGVRTLVDQAVAGQSTLDARQGEAVSAIPLRLKQSVEAIAARGAKAAAAALVVGQGSQRVGARIGEAVMALQIGDVTRQRIEHVAYALNLVIEALPAPDSAPPEGLVRPLQQAQLTDTADRFDQEVRRILLSLQALANDAREILRLGTEAFSSAGGRRGTFLGELASEVADVERLLGGFGAAHREQQNAASCVSEATGRLVAGIGLVRSLEADIRIMGLNMSFKCGRLGATGRPLSVIAQELRLYAKQIAGEAGDVRGDLDAILAVAGAMRGDAMDGGEAAEIAAVAESLANSLSCLTAVGRTFATSFAALERDGETIGRLLGEAVAHTTGNDVVGGILRRAAADLDCIPTGPGDNAETASPETERLRDLMLRSYTTETERTILARAMPRRPGHREEEMPASAPVAVASVDDFFF
jgi:hypothetical protein